MSKGLDAVRIGIVRSGQPGEPGCRGSADCRDRRPGTHSRFEPHRARHAEHGTRVLSAMGVSNTVACLERRPGATPRRSRSGCPLWQNLLGKPVTFWSSPTKRSRRNAWKAGRWCGLSMPTAQKPRRRLALDGGAAFSIDCRVDVAARVLLEEFAECAVREVEHVAATHTEQSFQFASFDGGQIGHGTSLWYVDNRSAVHLR